MAPTVAVVARVVHDMMPPDNDDGSESDSEDDFITPLLPAGSHSMPGDGPSGIILPFPTLPPELAPPMSSMPGGGASQTSSPIATLSPEPSMSISTLMYAISPAPSAPAPTDSTDSADQKATRPLRTLAAVFGFLAIVFVLAIVAIVLRARLKNRRRVRRARVRSVFWTRSRADAMAVVLAQPASYATPGQERWAKQWAELSHAAETRRVPATPAMGTLSSTRTRALFASTFLGRWSASLRSDVSPGSPPSYRSPSESYAQNSRPVVQTPATALTRSAAFVAPPPAAGASEETMS